MKLLLIALFAVAVCCQSVLSYGCDCTQACQTYIYSLEDIDRLMVQQSNYHQINLNFVNARTYYSRAQHILEALNDKITQSYNQRSYGSSGNGFDCKQLEDKILAKGKEFGIEKIGLESNLKRLMKIFNYQDERNSFNDRLLEESNNKTQACVQSLSELENTIKSLNSINNEQARKIKQQDENIKWLQKEKNRLQSKLNANAPAIHGETGKIYPEVDQITSTIDADGPAITSTTEITVSPASRNTTTASNTPTKTIPTVAGEDESSKIPDIDLRNNGGNSS